MASIDIIDSAGNAYRYNLPEDGTALLIGTGEECSVSLPHLTDLFPQHCTVSLQEEGYVIAVATPGAVLLAENQMTEAAVLVPGAVYNIGSATLTFDDGTATAAAPAQEEAPAEEQEEEEEPAVRKLKRPAGRRGHHDDSPLFSTPSYTEEDSVLHIIFRRLYVIAILAAAFLAGLTMRYWMMTGDFLIDELLK